jgi:hypothetical protein
MPSGNIPSEKAFLGIAPSRKVLRRGSNPTAATKIKRTWLGGVATALTQPPLDKAVWTTQAGAVAPLTDAIAEAGAVSRGRCPRDHGLPRRSLH